MNHIFQTLTLTFLIAGLVFSSCKKDVLCVSCPPNQPTQPPTSNTNKPPIAKAGNALVITLPIDSILLDGSASSDPDGSLVAWQWTKISGPSSFNIVNANSVQALATNLAEGVYQFEITVTDSLGLSDKDTTTVTVNKIYANEIIFSDVSWAGCWEYVCWIDIPDLYSHLPAGTSFKVFIKRDNTNTWVEAAVYTSQSTGAEYEYWVEYGHLGILAYNVIDPGNDTPDIKIVY